MIELLQNKKFTDAQLVQVLELDMALNNESDTIVLTKDNLRRLVHLAKLTLSHKKKRPWF